MAITTENYLKDLIKQKENLVSTLQECGVEASKEELFNTLVPKVKGLAGNLIFKGTIADELEIEGNLSHDSLMSIINALKPLVTYEEVVTDYTDSGYLIFGPPAGMGMWDHETWYKIDRFENDYHDIYIVGNDGYTYQFQLSMAEVDDAIKNATHFRGSYYSENDHYFAVKSLKTVPTGETKTLTLGTTNLAKLTDEEKALAINKGWNLL